MKEPPRLLSVSTHVPVHPLPRDETLNALPILSGGVQEAERFRGMVERSRIDRRYTETPISELLHLTPAARSRIFEQKSCLIAEDLGRQALLAAGIEGRDVRLVITTSCTGYMLPSVEAYVMPRLGIPSEARRVPITELGCSAGVGALGLATELLTGHGGYALVISIELCSSCMQTTDLAPSDVIGNILFADAAAAAVVGTTDTPIGPEIVGTRTVLWPDTTDVLGMRLSDTGLRLVLSPTLPQVVVKHLPTALNRFLAEHELSLSDVDFWIIHPGGPRVLESVGQELGLVDTALAPSWAVWSAYGNVSSATVFFILKALHERDGVPEGRLGVMIAFGPGLSCELALLRSTGWLSRPARS